MAVSGAQLVGNADGVAYGLRLSEHGQHHVRDVWPRDSQAVGQVAVYRGSIGAGEGPLVSRGGRIAVESRLPSRSRSSMAATSVYDATKDSPGSGGEDVPHEQVVAGVGARRVWSMARRDDPKPAVGQSSDVVAK
jgi:hypothetical protein